MNKRDCEKLKHSLSVIVANALMRKRASRVKEKVELSHTLADRLKSAYGISGRFRQTDLFERLQVIQAIRVNEADCKAVGHVKARVYVKKTLKLTLPAGQQVRLLQPAFLAVEFTTRLLN